MGGGPRRSIACGRRSRIACDACLEAEREYILRGLRDTHGMIREPHGGTARFDLRRTTERYKMEKLDISRQPQ
jgi:hypothetical protein